LKRGLENPWELLQELANERNHVCGVWFSKMCSFLREFFLTWRGGIVWNSRNGRLPEIMEEQFLADNVKGSWILHMLSRQFGEMNLQSRGSCFCGFRKGDFARIGGILEK